MYRVDVNIVLIKQTFHYDLKQLFNEMKVTNSLLHFNVKVTFNSFIKNKVEIINKCLPVFMLAQFFFLIQNTAVSFFNLILGASKYTQKCVESLSSFKATAFYSRSQQM